MTTTQAGTVREALSSAADALDAAGVESARLDAELLLGEATGRDRAALAASPEEDVGAPEARSFGAMVRRRIAREPLAYILGLKGFRSIELAVDPRALIPRPETELLVEVAVAIAPRSVLDVGTGCGAVALALATELPEATIAATDTSPEALELAALNAARLGFGERVALSVGSIPAAATAEVLVANLPYVAEAEWALLEPEITRYEPRRALVAGQTGLEAIEDLLADLAADPGATGALALEVGAGQAPAVAGLVRRAGFEHVERHRDLAGIERVVLGRR